MILSNVNIGTGPSAGDGDPLRTAFIAINNNFQIVKNNVNALTNSVNSVAGRTGNVILTVNDIVGLSSTYTSQANTTAANVGMKGYVDAKITANIALLVNLAPTSLDTIRELADAIGDDPNFAVNVALSVSSANTKMRGYVDGQITAANAGVTAANLGMRGYVDLANTIQSAQVGAANLAIIAANLGMKGYVDSVASQSIYGNVNVQAYTETMGFSNFSNVNVAAYVTTANSAIVGYVDQANTIQSQQIASANIGIIGYVDQANTIQSAQVNAANLAIVAANLGMKGYVDSVASQSIYGNANVASYLHANDYSPYSNVNVAVFTNLSTYAYSANVTAANLGMKGYVDSVASQSIYGNGNVKSYLTQFDGNIVPSANVTFSLGNVTNRWKDLYLSGNTIFLGDSTITTEGGRLVTTGAAISPPTGAVGFANVQLEAPTDFAQIRSYYVDNNFGYTANLKNYASAPIVWDELRSAKFYENSLIIGGATPDFSALDTSGGRFANAVATIDATGNIASLTITDGGVGYDSYYPYYATDPTGYDSNYIGRSFTGAPTGKSYRRISLIPTTASDVGNITSIGSFSRYDGCPTVGSNSYTWTGNTGTTISFTVDWSSNTVTSYTYTPALPALTSANDWQNWILDYQNTNDYGWWIGSGGSQSLSVSSSSAIYDYLSREALPNSLTYDLSNTTWYPNNLLVNNSASTATLSSQTMFVSFNRTAIGWAKVENSYGNPVYWLRGLTADSGISTGGDMTVAGDLRVTGDLYVSPDSIYLGDLQLSSSSGNLVVHGNVTANNVTTTGNISATYFLGNGALLTGITVGGGSYSNVQVATYLPTYSGNIANVRLGTSGVLTFADGTTQTTAASSGGGSYGNANVTAYTVSMGFTNYSNVNVKAYSESMGYQNYGNVNVAALITTNGLTNYSNVNVIAYLAGNVSAGNVFASGTSGKLGYTNGGFVQQITANSNGVSLNTVTGNIQLMGINLGVNGIHTVSFTNNKLEETNMILVSHHSGGVSNFAVGAYYVAPSTAIIWIRNITGADTSTVTPMLKFALIKAPGS